jgi:hypothetical protein
MLAKITIAALMACAITLGNASPVSRDNDGARPIVWQDPTGGSFCWAVEGGPSAGSEIGMQVFFSMPPYSR